MKFVILLLLNVGRQVWHSVEGGIPVVVVLSSRPWVGAEAKIATEDGDVFVSGDRMEVRVSKRSSRQPILCVGCFTVTFPGRPGKEILTKLRIHSEVVSALVVDESSIRLEMRCDAPVPQAIGKCVDIVAGALYAYGTRWGEFLVGSE